MTIIETMKQALEALESLNSTLFNNDDYYCGTKQHTAASEATTNLRTLIAQLEAVEPVATVVVGEVRWNTDKIPAFASLYDHPTPVVPDEKYNELIMAVGNKYPNETRHQTALRYIRMAENQTNSMVPKAAAPEVGK